MSSSTRTDTEASEVNDEDEEEKKYSTGAPLRRIDFASFLQYQKLILEDTYHHYYVTTDWNPEFYRVLASAGFISVAQEDYLIPEIQTYYCILDFPLLHIPRKTKKICRRYLSSTPSASCAIGARTRQSEMKLRMFANRDSALCIRKIKEYWGDDNWLSDRYVSCLNESGLKVFTFELYLEVEQRDNEDNVVGSSLSLLAGEVGYVIGSVYTSLTGFHARSPSSDDSKMKKEHDHDHDKNISSGDNVEDEGSSGKYMELSVDHFTPSPTSLSSSPTYRPHIPLLPSDLARCCGTIQLSALGYWLNTAGFSFWNLGHPPRKKAMKYKRDLGGAVFPRDEFLQRWNESTSLSVPELPASNYSPIDGCDFLPPSSECVEMDLSACFSTK